MVHFLPILSFLVGLLVACPSSQFSFMDVPDPSSIRRYVHEVFVELEDFKVVCLVCPKKLGSIQKVKYHRTISSHVDRLALYNQQKRDGVIRASDFPGLAGARPIDGDGTAGSVDCARSLSPDPASGRPESPPCAPVVDGHMNDLADQDVRPVSTVLGGEVHDRGVSTGSAAVVVDDNTIGSSGSALLTEPGTDPASLEEILFSIREEDKRAYDARFKLANTPQVVMPAGVRALLYAATSVRAADLQSEDEYVPPLPDDVPPPGPTPGSTPAWVPEELVLFSLSIYSKCGSELIQSVFPCCEYILSRCLYAVL